MGVCVCLLAITSISDLYRYLSVFVFIILADCEDVLASEGRDSHTIKEYLYKEDVYSSFLYTVKHRK